MKPNYSKVDGIWIHRSSGLTEQEHADVQKVFKLHRPFGVVQRQYADMDGVEKPVATGNFDGNRHAIKGVTIHTTAGGLSGSLGWFNNPASQASSTYMVDTNGDLYKLLEEYFVPYTNGNYQSNQECITIENVDNGLPQGTRDERQIKKNILLTANICLYYGLTIDRVTIKGHNEIAPYTHPSCPGNMPLDRIAKDATANNTPTAKLILAKVKQILSSTRTDDQKVKDTHWATRPQ